ncbi:MAG: glucuronate isomerase [Candidatus Sumerlaeaceae bacterium]
MTPETQSLLKSTLAASQIRPAVDKAIMDAPILDMHTHLFAPQFSTLNLWGIDELLTYHYLVAELLRVHPIPEDSFWALSKAEQAELVWEYLFVRNSPISEATAGVITVLNTLGLDTSASDLSEARDYFMARDFETHLNEVLRLSGVDQVVMTNDPFDAAEIPYWRNLSEFDNRFRAVVRLDCMLNDYPNSIPRAASQGFTFGSTVDSATITQARRFLDAWIERMNPVYMAVSLPDTFEYPEQSIRNTLLEQVVLPTCQEHDLSMALMIGVRRQVNPRLRLAGDGVGRANLGALQALLQRHPENRFLVTVLARENQHELCVLARKFRNLMPFGCWWFVNNPSIIREITDMRFEMLGTSFIPQHSDSRILEQLLYKWPHSRRIIADSLIVRYEQLAQSGRTVSQSEIERDVQLLFEGNFRQSIGEDEIGGDRQD